MDIARALTELSPNAQWYCIGNTVDGLVWESEDIPQPSVLEIEAKVAELTAAEPMRLLRRERDRLIAETDWWVLPDRTPTDEQLAYRQALRNLPDTATPVLDSSNRLGISGITWPTKP